MVSTRRPNPTRLTTCAIVDCNKQAIARTLCKNHYYTARRRNALPDSYINERHGKVRTPEHRAWSDMKTRVFNPNNKRWDRYGERGIDMCSGLSNSFIHFVKVVGKRPADNYSIDRINNDSGYWCGVCVECISRDRSLNIRWADKATQAQNRSKRKDNKSGVTGVGYLKLTGNWGAYIGVRRKRIFLGEFKNKQDAVKAREQAVIQYWGDK